MPSLTYHIQGLINAAGLVKAGEILLRRTLRLSKVVFVNVRGHGRLEVRPTDSDLFVLSQVFGWNEYAIDAVRLKRLNDIATFWKKAGITPVTGESLEVWSR